MEIHGSMNTYSFSLIGIKRATFWRNKLVEIYKKGVVKLRTTSSYRSSLACKWSGKHPNHALIGTAPPKPFAPYLTISSYMLPTTSGAIIEFIFWFINLKFLYNIEFLT